MITGSLRCGLIGLLCLWCLPVQAYWATLDVSELSLQRIRINNTSHQDIRCDVRAYNDKLFIDIPRAKQSPDIRVIAGMNVRDFSLHCQPLPQAVRLTPWRYHRHWSPAYAYRFVFQ